jgi:hypothetical protein
MARNLLAAIVAVLAVAPGVALAQAAADQVVATAPTSPPPPVKTSGQVASVSDAEAAANARDDGPLRDNRIHGEVSVGVGTNGYREISGVATAPIGDVGQATIAIDSEQYNYHRR